MRLLRHVLPSRRAPRSLRFTGGASQAEFDQAVARVSFWYHSFYFDNGYSVRGNYDIGRNIDEYGFPDDLEGLTVLDVGAASGWFSFWLAQGGAQVTSYDVTHELEIDANAQFETPTTGPPAEWTRGADVLAGLLGSRVERVRGRVYDLEPALFAGRAFDLVLMGALLQHVRDPIGALMAARRVCAHRLIATTWHMDDGDALKGDERPLAELPALGPTPAAQSAWWRPNRKALKLWLSAAGFASADVSRTVTLTADRVTGEHNNGTQTLTLINAQA